jgi:hypothetical protein
MTLNTVFGDTPAATLKPNEPDTCVPLAESRLLTSSVTEFPCTRISPDTPSAEPNEGFAAPVVAVPPGTMEPLLGFTGALGLIMPSRSELMLAFAMSFMPPVPESLVLPVLPNMLVSNVGNDVCG